MRESENNKTSSGQVKAVIFIPYTHNSELARLLKENELLMEKITGVRMKIEEKTGIQLENELCRSNPWSG